MVDLAALGSSDAAVSSPSTGDGVTTTVTPEGSDASGTVTLAEGVTALKLADEAAKNQNLATTAAAAGGGDPDVLGDSLLEEVPAELEGTPIPLPALAIAVGDENGDGDAVDLGLDEDEAAPAAATSDSTTPASVVISVAIAASTEGPKPEVAAVTDGDGFATPAEGDNKSTVSAPRELTDAEKKEKEARAEAFRAEIKLATETSAFLPTGSVRGPSPGGRIPNPFAVGPDETAPVAPPSSADSKENSTPEAVVTPVTGIMEAPGHEGRVETDTAATPEGSKPKTVSGTNTTDPKASTADGNTDSDKAEGGTAAPKVDGPDSAHKAPPEPITANTAEGESLEPEAGDAQDLFGDEEEEADTDNPTEEELQNLNRVLSTFLNMPPERRARGIARFGNFDPIDRTAIMTGLNSGEAVRWCRALTVDGGDEALNELLTPPAPRRLSDEEIRFGDLLSGMGYYSGPIDKAIGTFFIFSPEARLRILTLLESQDQDVKQKLAEAMIDGVFVIIDTILDAAEQPETDGPSGPLGPRYNPAFTSAPARKGLSGRIFIAAAAVILLVVGLFALRNHQTGKSPDPVAAASHNTTRVEVPVPARHPAPAASVPSTYTAPVAPPVTPAPATSAHDTTAPAISASADTRPTPEPMAAAAPAVPAPAPVVDTDGDGTPDAYDDCRVKPGPARNHGCPVETAPPAPVAARAHAFSAAPAAATKNTLRPKPGEDHSDSWAGPANGDWLARGKPVPARDWLKRTH